MFITLQYKIGTYEGEITVSGSENESPGAWVARAKKRLNISLPMYYESWTVLKMEEEHET